MTPSPGSTTTPSAETWAPERGRARLTRTHRRRVPRWGSVAHRGLDGPRPSTAPPTTAPPTTVPRTSTAVVAGGLAFLVGRVLVGGLAFAVPLLAVGYMGLLAAALAVGGQRADRERRGS